MKQAWRSREYWTMAVIVALFIAGSVFSLWSLRLLQDTARVVHYVGVIRASSQMLVTQELMGLSDDRIAARIEEIINELETGQGPNDLVLLRDAQYLQELALVKSHWEQLKDHIAMVRLDRLQNPAPAAPSTQPSQILFGSSQIFYDRLSNMASSAETFSNRQINRSRITIISASIFALSIVILSLVYLQRLKRASDRINEEITAMKDNLQIGLFFMDQHNIIQPQYSKALETLLNEPDLGGRDFTELLASSVTEKERETLKDYFSMVINRSFDSQMLEDVNPINEFTYIHTGSKTEKNLRCKFVPVDRGGGKIVILSLIEDITAEKALEQQLSREEGKREEEMHSIFEIVQIEPRIFNDFLEDTEYEFSRINDLLKNKELSSQFAVMDIYQSIHAIKSNAVILGIKSFSDKLQLLESEIKKIGDTQNISFEDILHITIQIEQIMRDKDKLRLSLDKIQSFRSSEIRNPDEYVLVQTLIRASDKTARDLEKKVRFVAESIDPQAMEAGPRRIMKEVLTQLVRNAVYHGIEDPQTRIAAGKDETGLIHLSISVEQDRLHIKLTDDGWGLNFTQIRKRARELELVDQEEDLEDKKHLAQLIFSPGFSTADDAGIHAGRGVGLSLVRERLHEIGGSIKLNTEEGKGTVFNIFIPLEAREAS
jgi:two-component system chemotaxis sensor kinase CheA